MGIVNELRNYMVYEAWDSYQQLKKYSNDSEYQNHLQNIMDLIRLTEQELLLTRHKLKLKEK